MFNPIGGNFICWICFVFLHISLYYQRYQLCIITGKLYWFVYNFFAQSTGIYMLIPFTFCRISAHAKHFSRTTEDEICRVTRDLQYTEMMHRIWSSKLSRVCGTSSVKCTKEAASRFALMPFVHQGKILNRNNSGRIVIGPHKAENMSGPNVRNSNFLFPKTLMTR